jgi:hypothetical protein
MGPQTAQFLETAVTNASAESPSGSAMFAGIAALIDNEAARILRGLGAAALPLIAHAQAGAFFFAMARCRLIALGGHANVQSTPFRRRSGHTVQLEDSPEISIWNSFPNSRIVTLRATRYCLCIAPFLCARIVLNP